MNRLEFGISFQDKFIPKIIVTITQTKPELEMDICPPPPPPPQSLDTLKEARANRVEGVDQKHTLWIICTLHRLVFIIWNCATVKLFAPLVLCNSANLTHRIYTCTRFKHCEFKAREREVHYSAVGMTHSSSLEKFLHILWRREKRPQLRLEGNYRWLHWLIALSRLYIHQR